MKDESNTSGNNETAGSEIPDHGTPTHTEKDGVPIPNEKNPSAPAEGTSSGEEKPTGGTAPVNDDTVKALRDKAAMARKHLPVDSVAVKRKRIIVVAGTIVAVLVLLTGAFMLSSRSDATVTNSGGESEVFPVGVSADSVGWSSNTGTEGTVAVYEDYQCPACKIFETYYGEQLQNFAASNNLTLTYYPMTFLDRNLRNTSSAQATNAFGCAIDQGAGLAYHDAVYANQPEREGQGWTVQQLKDLGRTAGLAGKEYDSFAKCVDAGTYSGWGTAVNASAAEAGVRGTPTVYVNGTEVPREDMDTEDKLFAKINELLQPAP